MNDTEPVPLPSFCRPDGSGSRITIHLNPRAGQDRICGRHGAALKIRIKAPPVDGRANEALIRFLSGILDLPTGALRIVAGLTGRDKILLVAGMPPEEVVRRLALAAGSLDIMDRP